MKLYYRLKNFWPYKILLCWGQTDKVKSMPKSTGNIRYNMPGSNIIPAVTARPTWENICII